MRREYLRRLKQDFDARGIEIPYSRLTLYAGSARDGKAPALPVAVAGLGPASAVPARPSAG